MQGPLLVMLAAAVSCNFDAAFKRYCENNPLCDAGAGPEPGPEAGPETGPESGPETVPNRDLGDVETPPSIPLPKVCGRFNDDCDGRDEICHPFFQVCMQRCETTSDCPSYLDSCAELREPGGPTRPSKVCTCTSSSVCNSIASGFVCHPSDRLCEPLCKSDEDCTMFQPTRVCAQPGSICQPTETLCFGNRDCPSADQPRCDPVNQRCTGCTASSDCGERTDGLTQCGSTGSCVGP